MIKENIIRQYLHKNYQNIDFQIFNKIDSTNVYAKKIVPNINKNTVIIANSQTNGHGKFGKNFFSPANTGIYMTIILKDSIKTKNVFSITFLCAIAVCKAIDKLTSKKAKLKWINDVFIDDKKCCGILTECETNLKTGLSNNIVAGIGLNVSTVKFPKELKSIATSLQNCMDRNIIISEIINNFFKLYKNLTTKQIVEKYKKFCFVLGKDICYTKDNIKYMAKATNINKFGNLIIKDYNGKTKTLECEEIKIV